MLSVLKAHHFLPVGGKNSGIQTIHKILQFGYYWPTIHQDSHDLARSRDRFE